MNELSNYRTLNGRVLIEKMAVETKTSAGIILPEKEGRGKLAKGKIVRVDENDLPVKVGEIVYFRYGIGFDVILDAKPYVLLKAGELDLVEG
jgi:co-chaperonin GroES (HSP10)